MGANTRSCALKTGLLLGQSYREQMLQLAKPGFTTFNFKTKAMPGPRGVLLEYANDATVHGVRYLASRKVSVFGKLCWLAAMLTCAVFAFVFMQTAWAAYRDSPTRTSVQSTHYPLHLVPFPAVTMCPATKVRRTVGLDELARYLKLDKEDPDTERRLWPVLAALSMFQFPFYYRVDDYRQGYQPFVAQLENFNITEFMLKVLPPCDVFFQECYWQGTQVNCCEIFKIQRYEAGFCYSFNSLAVDSKFHCPPLLNVHLDSDALRVAQSQTCSLLWNGVSGTTTGLEVFLPHSSVEDRMGVGQRDVDGARVFIHHPLQFPEAGKGLLMSETNETVMTIQVSASVTESSTAIRTLAPEVRQCYFPDEWRLQVSNTYSQKNCLLECRLQFFISECQCVPYFFNHFFDEYPVCNLSSFKCVVGIDRDLRFLQLQATKTRSKERSLNCSHCYSTCNEVAYSLDVALTRDFNRVNRGAYLDIYFGDLTAIKYRRELTFDVMQLIVSLGGTASLFLGVSILSGVELVYYAAVMFRAALRLFRPAPKVENHRIWHVSPIIQQP